MGFMKWLKRATTLPKSIRKINLGHSIGRSITGAVKGFEGRVSQAAGSIGGGAAETVEAAQNVNNLLPIMVGVGVVLVIVLLVRRR